MAGIIDAVLVEAQRADLDQPRPLAGIAGQPGRLHAKQTADLAHRHLGRDPGKAGSPFCTGAGASEILVDDMDLFRSPSQASCTINQGVPACRENSWLCSTWDGVDLEEVGGVWYADRRRCSIATECSVHEL